MSQASSSSEWSFFGELKEAILSTLGLSPKCPHCPAVHDIIRFENQKQVVELMEAGYPVIMTLEVNGDNNCRSFKRAFARASHKFGHQVKFVSVDCTQHAGFCASRKPFSFPHVELFVPPTEVCIHIGVSVLERRKWRYSFRFLSLCWQRFLMCLVFFPMQQAPGSVIPFDMDWSNFGFQVFFTRHLMSLPVVSPNGAKST
jgi:hypothetical protein